jgi:hypothetical protein
MINTRRELQRINRQMRQYHAAAGEGVLWYEFAAEDYVQDNYLNAGGRSYKPGIIVPAMWVSEYEDDETSDPEGRRYVPTLRLAVNVGMARHAGMSDVEDARRHLNDILLYSRTLWNVNSYQIRGRLRNESTIIGVSAHKIYPDEDMNFDVFPQFIDSEYTRRPEPVINDKDDDVVDDTTTDDDWTDFPDHDNPVWRG